MSALADRAEDYLRLRRALGAKLTDTGPLLASLTGYLDAHSETVITVNNVLAWASGPHAGRAQTARRITVARGFAAYLHAFDPSTEVPPGHLVAGRSTRIAPHIYSEQEVLALIHAANALRPRLRGAGLATLIGLMAAAGLRTGEALRLDRVDLDPVAGTLSIWKSKWGKSRRIPLHPTALVALAEYAVVRDRHRRTPACPALLLSAGGSRITPAELHRWFPAVRAQAGVTGEPGRRPPRLYDLRHTFAVRTLTDWHAAGLDVRRQLPVLSTYLGHVNPDNTYWYLQAVPELMSVLADRVAAYLDEGA